MNKKVKEWLLALLATFLLLAFAFGVLTLGVKCLEKDPDSNLGKVIVYSFLVLFVCSAIGCFAGGGRR